LVSTQYYINYYFLTKQYRAFETLKTILKEKYPKWKTNKRVYQSLMSQWNISILQITLHRVSDGAKARALEELEISHDTICENV